MDSKTEIIQVAEIALEATRVKIKDERGLVYSIFKTKKDGTPTQYYEKYQSMGDITGENIEVSFNESPTGQGGTYRNIFAIEHTSQPITAQKQPLMGYKPQSSEPKKDVDWDAIAEGKVRHGVSVAMIEEGKKLDTETVSEINKWVKFIMTGKLTPANTPDDDLPF